MLDIAVILGLLEKVAAKGAAAKSNARFAKLLSADINALRPLLEAINVASSSLTESQLDTLAQSIAGLQSAITCSLQLLNVQSAAGFLRICSAFSSNNAKGQFEEALHLVHASAKKVVKALLKDEIPIPAEALDLNRSDSAVGLVADELQKLKELEKQAMALWGDEKYETFIEKCHEIIALSPDDVYTGHSLYNIACALSLNGDAAGSLGYLQKAVDAGFSDFERMSSDSDLKLVREESAFKELIEVQRTRMQSAEYWRSHLTEEEIAQATLLFKQVDADQSNTIQANEFRTLILSIDETMTEERIQEVMKSVDSNGDGVISMEEWLNAFAKDLHF